MKGEQKGKWFEGRRGPGGGLEREGEREALECRLLGQGPGGRAPGMKVTGLQQVSVIERHALN